MSTRPLQTPAVNDRLSSLSLGDSVNDRRLSVPGHQRQPSDTPEPTGLVQRCVIVQKDQHGFGFTVSGDRIVLVQSVKAGGAAMRAGLQEGDRIIKVNGTLVTNSSHLEVVKLIKSGAYVALTLLGPPPSTTNLPLQQDPVSGGSPRNSQAYPPPPLPPPPPQPMTLPYSSSRITGPRPLQDPEVQKHAAQILKNMLKQEEAELQRLEEDRHRDPSLEERIEGAKRRVSQLQVKIRQETGASMDYVRSRSESSAVYNRGSEGRFSVDSQDGDSGLDSGTERAQSLSEGSLNRNSVLSDAGNESPWMSPLMSLKGLDHQRQGSDSLYSFPSDQSSGRTSRHLIIGPEEEEYDANSFEEADGPFQDLESLKHRPAHMAVFMRFLLSQADPSSLLFYLCADVYHQSVSKDARSLGKEIWTNFLDTNAPLKIKIPETMAAEIEVRLRSPEEARLIFAEAQENVLPEIQSQIQDYRTKRMMGLGNLYGENNLMNLNGDGSRERHLAEKLIGDLVENLNKYEEERSGPIASVMSTYMRHVGLKVRPTSFMEKTQCLAEKDKWLPFFPKPKKPSSNKKDKERDNMDDKKRNPILKYIGKPKGGSQSIKPGNVRNIIQHFENNQYPDLTETGQQRLSTGSIPEDLLDSDSSRSEVKLGRSESLKGREELKKSRKGDNVPRSRSDVDMDAAAEATRLHQSASSSASSLSARSLENPTPPYTPKSGRRSMDSPNPIIYGMDSLLQHHLEDDLGRLSDVEPEPESQSWQQTIGREVVSQLEQREIDRQEVINELFLTESSHLRILRVLDQIFYQRMKKENLLNRDELALLFPNLSEVIEVHNSLSESMRVLREEGPVVKEIGDIMLARFDDTAGQEFQKEVAEFCCNQSLSLELIRLKQKKDQRFQLFMQEAESNPQCRRLQLKDLIVSEMQRLTKYPLLLENIMKYTDGQSTEHKKLLLSRDRCREILRHVNEAVKEAENRQHLEEYQRRLDTTSLERSNNPLAMEFKQLDLTTKRMIHEGPLTWRISKDKTIDLQVLLLEDLLVLLQKQDEKYLLKCHSKTMGSSDVKQTFSPVIKLNSVLIRSVATDKRALFILSTSELGPQIYELVAGTSLEKNTWKEILENAVKYATGNMHTQTGCLQPTINHIPAPTKVVLTNLQRAPEFSPKMEPEDAPSEDDNQSDVTVTAQLRLAEGAEGQDPEDVTTPTQQDDGREEDIGSVFHYPPMFEKGLADSALEDVEILRTLILQSRSLPETSTEPKHLPDASQEMEEDVTPTPSVAGVGEGIQTQIWDPQMDNQAQGWSTETSEPQDQPVEGHVNSMHSESGDPGLDGHITEAVREDYCDSGYVDSTGFSTDICPLGVGDAQSGTQDMETLPTVTRQQSFDQGSFKVVRKEGASSEVDDVTKALSHDSQSRIESQALETGKGIHVDGNFFYLAMPDSPQESTTDWDSAAPAEHTGSRQSIDQEEELQSEDVVPPVMLVPPLPQNLVIRDVEEVFRTIEQLTLKLRRLKEVEIAHCKLLKSLGENGHERIAVSSPDTGAESTKTRRPSGSPSLTKDPNPTSSACEEGSSSDTPVRTPSMMLSTGF